MGRKLLSLFAMLLLPLFAGAQKSAMPVPKWQFSDVNGVPMAGGKVCTFVSGTSTPLATWTDYTGAAQNTNPINLDSGGFANIWLGSGTYRITLQDSSGDPAACDGVQQWSVDGITSASGSFAGTYINVTQAGSTTPVQIGSVWYPGTASGLVTPPGAAPSVVTSATGGTIPAGTYYVKAGYKNSNGRTTPSPATTVVLSGATSSIVSVGDGGWFWLTGAWGQEVFASNDNINFYLQTPTVVATDFMVDSTAHYSKMGAGVQKLYQSLVFSGTLAPTTNTAVIDPLQVALNATRRAPTASAAPVPFGTLFVPAIDGTVNPSGQFILTTPLIAMKGDHIIGSGGPNTTVNLQTRIIGASTWNNEKLATVMVFGGDATIENVGIQAQSSNALMVLGPLAYQSGTQAPMKVEKVTLRAPAPALTGIQVAAFKRSGAAALVNSSNTGNTLLAIPPAAGVTSATTGAMNATAGNLLVCTVRWGGNGGQTVTSVSDTAGNTYSALSQFTFSTERIRMFYIENALGHATNQFTANFSAAAFFVTVKCDQFSGIEAVAALDVSATGTQTGSSAQSVPFTTTNANDLIYAALEGAYTQTASTWGAGTGYTIAQDGGSGLGAALGTEYQSVAGIQTAVTATASFTPTLDFAAYVAVGIIYDIYFTDVSMSGGVYLVEYRNAAGGLHYFERGRWDISGEGAFRNVPGWIDPDAGTHSACGTGGFCNGVGPVLFRRLRLELGSGRIWDFWNTNAEFERIEHADATIRAGTDSAIRIGSTTGSGNAAGQTLRFTNSTAAGSSNARVGIMVDSSSNTTSIQLVGQSSPPQGATGSIDANNIQLFLDSGLNPTSTFSAGNPATLPVGNLVLNAPNNSVFVGGGSGSPLAANGGQWFEIPDRLVFNTFRGNNDWRRANRVSLKDSLNAFGVVDNKFGLILYSSDDTTPLFGVNTDGLLSLRGNARIQMTGGGTPQFFVGPVASTSVTGAVALRNNDCINWRNQAGGADIAGWCVNTSDEMESRAVLGIMPLANATPFGKAGKTWAAVGTLQGAVGGVTPAAGAFTTVSTSTSLTVNGSVSQGTAFKFASITTGSITASSSAAVTLTFSGVFTNAAWMPVCSVLEATASTVTLRLHHIESITNTTNATVVVRVVNDDGGGAHTGVLYCTGVSGP